MTTMSVAPANQTREALLAYFDALTLAEPIQARLWQMTEITLTQLSVLRQLRDGPRTLGILGETIGLSATSVSRLVDRLERRRLVARRRDTEDRRCVHVHLAPAGERLLGEVKVLRGSNIHRAFESMNPAERHSLTMGLRRLVELTHAVSAQDEKRS